MKYGWFVAYCLLCPWYAAAQDHAWWADNVGWDGISHWKSYLIFSPAYLGPNALPIPDMSGGLTPAVHSLSLESHAHLRRGEQTLNAYIRGCYAAVPEKIAFSLEFLPVEWFAVSHALKTERRVFHRNYHERFATGDVYAHTWLQLSRQEQGFADVALRVGYRFPTSNGVGSARFTDSPGYHFDLSLGRSQAAWRFFGMLGFLVWQTNTYTHVQNDALLFGVGSSWGYEAWSVEGSLRAYFGYLQNGDDPMAARMVLTRTGSPLGWRIGLEQGLLDFRYSSAFMGLRWSWH
ncbi:MAG: hypothetical protein ACKOA4_01970 [Haliscomenobacter sp.]